MIAEKIRAYEITLKDLFEDKYIFEIPNFQRPFAWEKENFEQLVGDIKEALEVNIDSFGDNVDEYEPYFLGSVILWTKELKGDGAGRYAVIDGQQRLISMSILLAVLRDLTDQDKARETLQKAIYQESNEFAGTPESVRIKLREKEEAFFKQYILTQGGTTRINEVNKHSLSEPKRHMLEAVEVFRKAFQREDGNVDMQFLNRYIQYVLQKITFVVIKTTNLASAFRLFNVINTRGMPLTNADLLKSTNLSAVPKEQQEKYTRIWEDMEEELGSEKLEMLISFVRSIKLKEKARKAIYEEFEEKIFRRNPQFKGTQFIQYLRRVYEAYRRNIEEASLTDGRTDLSVYYHNLISLMRDFLPFNDWMAALVLFKQKFDDDLWLYNFVTALEKKIVVDWITGLSFSERLTQLYNVMKLIEDSTTPSAVLDHATFTDDLKLRKQELRTALDDPNLYSRGRTRIPKYILLRIDMERSYNTNKKVSYGGQITVEHILPRTPTSAYWLARFSEEDRLRWTNRLGNLVLLNSRKNSQASNKAFPDKLKDYFEKKSDFDITAELRKYEDWNIGALRDRHHRLVEEALKLWIPGTD